MAFHILALSGGGYMGLFSAVVLAEMERQVGEPIARRFDLIAGTSIGGIVALGLAAEIPADTILGEFASRGTKIFSDRPRPRSKLDVGRDILRYVYGPKYRAVQLRAAVDSILGDRLLGDAKHRVLVPAVNMTKGSIQMFKTPHHENFVRDHRLRMTDIALATSAAPTYFPLAAVGDSLFVDGGIFANAPDLCALHEATNFLGAQKEDVRILSIGTTTSKFSLAHAIGSDLGAYQWLIGGRLWSTISAAQQQLVDFLMKHQLEDRYLRIDHQQSPEQQAYLGLDVATEDATKTIRGMADGAYQAATADPVFQEMLRHKPGAPKFFYGPQAG